MKELLLLFVFFEFLSFSKEDIMIKRKENNDCPSIQDILLEIKNNQYSLNSNDYGFNAQNCGIKDVKDKTKNVCCYVSLSLDGNWYNFCGEVQSEGLTQNSIDEIIDKIKEEEEASDTDTETIPNITPQGSSGTPSGSSSNNLRNLEDEIIKKMKKGIQIDCFNQRLNIIKSSLIILLILII